MSSGGRWAIALALALIGGCGGGEGGDDDEGVGDGAVDDDTDGEPGGDEGPRWEALIRRAPYPRLVVELDAAPGRALRDGVADELVARLDAVLDKPEGIAVTADGELDAVGDDHGWTIGELDALADATFDLPVEATAIKIHVLLVDGRYDAAGGGVILGVAWAHRNIALFVDTIEQACGAGLPALLREQGCAAAQLAIAIHEVGHVIGLVDNGVAMVAPHKDAEHGAHDVSDACVMYWAYDGGALIDRVAGDLIAGGDGDLGFDEACLADLAAVRDR